MTNDCSTECQSEHKYNNRNRSDQLYEYMQVSQKRVGNEPFEVAGRVTVTKTTHASFTLPFYS